MVNVAKTASTLAASAPKLSSRLGGFHLIILAAFTLLGFYVCFNQIKALKIDVISLKALLQPPPKRVGGGQPAHNAADSATDAEAEADRDENDDFEQIGEDDFRDDGLRDILMDLVDATNGGAVGGVTVIVGDASAEIGEAEVVEIADGAPDSGNAANAADNANAANTVDESEGAKPDRETDNLAVLSVKELKAMALDKGLTVRQGAKKADIIASIREIESDACDAYDACETTDSA